MSKHLLDPVKIEMIVALSTNEVIFGPRSGPRAEVVEYGKKNIVVQGPLLKPRKGEWVRMKGEVFTGLEFDVFDFTGKIVLCEARDEAIRCTFEFLQFNKKLWNRFLMFSKERQVRIDKILTSIKGE
jgi:hypothetical protein